MFDPTQQDLKQILAELKDVRKDVRRTAVMKLGMVGGDDALRALVRTLENDFEDLIVRGRAAMMLGKLGDTRAVEPLIRALDAPGFQTPYQAILSLGRLGDARAIMPLLAVATNSKDKTREAALQALEKLGHEISTDVLATEPEA